MHLVPVAGLFALLATCLLWLYRHLTSPLRSVPGPFMARFTDAWYFVKLRRCSFQVVNQQLHQEYGPIVRYGPNRYSFNDVHASKTIYGYGAQFPKSSWYIPWTQPGQISIFADRDIKRHAQNRRVLQNYYSMSSLVSYEPYVDECADLFSQRLSELAQGTVDMDMGHWLQCYAFDVIGCITYSKRFGFLDYGQDVGHVMSSLDGFFGYATLAGLYPSFHPYFSKLFDLLAGPKGTGRTYLMKFTQDRMEEHQASPKSLDPDEKEAPGKTTDFLTKFFSKHLSDPDYFTRTHIILGCASNVVAGSDTTAISLSAILYYLMKNPKCMARLREEIDEYPGKSGQEPKTHITFRESQSMPYLQAVIKEALRLHPATGLPMERVVPPGGATISGRFFPEGTIAGINSWVQHYNSDIFGQDAHLFRPERWTDEVDAVKLSLMNSHWIPFGLGSRTCIGRHISHLEMSKLVPRLVRDFDFELQASKGSSWRIRNTWFVKPVDFQVRVKARGS